MQYVCYRCFIIIMCLYLQLKIEDQLFIERHIVSVSMFFELHLFVLA